MKKIYKNLIVCCVCFFAITALNFALPRALPGDPVAYLTGYDEEQLSAQQYEYYKHALHLDESVSAQFGYYLQSLFDGSLGYSYKKSETVSALIFSRLAATLQISLSAVVLSSALALLLGLAAGSKKGALDSVLTPLNVAANCFPTFVIGMFLIIPLCFERRIFPYSGLNSANVSQGTAACFFDRLYHLTLPILTLTLGMLPSRYLLMRNTAHNVSSEKYVLFARQRGLSETKIRFKYILPNIIQPFITTTGLSIGASIGGSVVVENLFGINGMGKLLTEAVETLDYPLIQGILFASTCVAIIGIVVADALCLLAEPRLRKEEV